MKKIFMSAALASVLFLGSAQAHAIWTQIIADRLSIIYGDGPYNNEYNSKQLYYSMGYDKNFKEFKLKAKRKNVVPLDENKEVSIVVKEHITTFDKNEDLVVLALKSNHGFYFEVKKGELKKGNLLENPKVKEVLAVEKYNVSYVRWDKKPIDIKPQPVPNIPFQIVPLENPLNKKVGETLKVQVIDNGKPVAGVDIKTDFDHDGRAVVKTDKNGMATIKIPHDGSNVFAAYSKSPYIKDDKKATHNSIFTTLSFTIYGEMPDL